MIPRKPPAVSTQEMSAHKKVIRIENDVTLQSMAQRMSLKATELLMKLLSMGMSNVHINTTLDADTAKILASEFGWEVEDVGKSEEQTIAEARGEEAEVTPEADTAGLRPPVVTVMGHVDHGKTSLLDRIRKANVAGGEAGGITQHIGAYKVETKHGTVVFLDTPGHEAFTQMRARGASVTDIVVLVVAADDGVMPQTKEAVAHAKAAKVPIIVAINKIDKPGADPERVKRELGDLGLVPEEWGGDTLFVNVSAVTGEGIERLLESIALQSELLELRANASRPASGTVLEALLDRGRGPVARVLVQDGTLRVGDFVLAGAGFGKVRAMTNEHGKQVQEAGPSTPVEILGLSEVPNAGDRMDAVKDSKKAQEIAESRQRKDGEEPHSGDGEGFARGAFEAHRRERPAGAARHHQGRRSGLGRSACRRDGEALWRQGEALHHSRSGGRNHRGRRQSRHRVEGHPRRLQRAPGRQGRGVGRGEQDRDPPLLDHLQRARGREGRDGGPVASDLGREARRQGRGAPNLQGRGERRSRVATSSKARSSANGKVRLVRDGLVVWDGKISSLKRFKDDAREVLEGFECGISLDGYNDIKEKDILECYEVEEIKQRL